MIFAEPRASVEHNLRNAALINQRTHIISKTTCLIFKYEIKKECCKKKKKLFHLNWKSCMKNIDKMLMDLEIMCSK